MSTTMTETRQLPPTTDGGRRFFNAPPPTIGAGAAAKAVAEDMSALVRAEIEYARAELQQTAREKAAGGALFGAAGAAGWLGLQALLVAAGFALAAAGLPGWAAALIVGVALLLAAGAAALAGRAKLSAPAKVRLKERAQEDVEWIKSHLPNER